MFFDRYVGATRIYLLVLETKLLCTVHQCIGAIHWSGFFDGLDAAWPTKARSWPIGHFILRGVCYMPHCSPPVPRPPSPTNPTAPRQYRRHRLPSAPPARENIPPGTSGMGEEAPPAPTADSTQGAPVLPTELVTEILARLPAKSAGRFRCVSHAWLAMLSSAYFVDLHLRRANR